MEQDDARAAPAGLGDLALDATGAPTAPGSLTDRAQERRSDPALRETAASERIPPRVVAGRFEIRGELGRGAFGAVFRAFDTASRDEVAIKVIDIVVPEIADRARRELRSARKVTHPNVVRLYDLVEAGNTLVISMELVEGQTLERWIASTPSPDLATILRMGREIVAGVAAAHAVGVIHRDLKPANVMVRARTGACVVADFGIARSIVASTGPDATREGELIGTPLYMAPEQLVGSIDVGPPVDVYALGLVLFELASGRRPQPGVSLVELASARMTGTVPDLQTVRPELPPTLAAVIARCLAPLPADRYSDARELAEALGALGGPSTEPRPPRAPRPFRRWALPAIGGGLLVTAILVAGPRLLGTTTTTTAVAAPPLRVHLRPVVDASPATWPTRAAVSLLDDYLTTRSRTYLMVGPAEDRDLDIEVAVTESEAGVTLIARTGKGDSTTVFSSRQAPDLLNVAAYTGRDLVASFEKGREPRLPTGIERRAMTDVGARSLPAYQRYVEGLAGRSVPTLDEAIQLDPGWAHPRAARWWLAATPSPTPTPASVPGPPQDPLGDALVAVLSDPAAREDRARVDAAIGAAGCPSGDRLCHLVQLELGRQAGEQRLAASQQACGLAFDDELACKDFAGLLAEFGLRENARSFIQDWVARAPSDGNAIVAAAVERIRAGDAAAGTQAAAQLALLAPVITLFEQNALYIAAGDYVRAGDTAARIGRTPGDEHASQYLLATVLIAQGRFSHAQRLLRAASDGATGPLRDQAREALVDLQQGMGDRAGAAATIDAWLVSSQPPPALSKIVRTFQRDLLRGTRPCPAVAGRLDPLEDRTARTMVGQALRRLAAEHGCGTCAEVIRDGSGGAHRGSSNVAFGWCALETGAIELAVETFQRESMLLLPVVVPASAPSPFSAMVASLGLAEALAKQGKVEDALRALDRLLAQWTNPDQTVPALEAARKLRARLGR